MSSDALQRLINVCISCPESKVNEPLAILNSYKCKETVFDKLKGTLIRSRDNSTKVRITKIIAKYIQNNDNTSLLDNKRFVTSFFDSFVDEIPIFYNLKEIKLVIKIFSLFINKLSVEEKTELLQIHLKSKKPYSSLIVVIISKEMSEFYTIALDYLTNLITEMNHLCFYALSIFLHDTKLMCINDKKNSIKMSGMKSAIISSFRQSYSLKLACSYLFGSIFSTFPEDFCLEVLRGSIQSIQEILKDDSEEIRVAMSQSLSNLPEKTEFLSKILFSMCHKLVDFNDAFGESCMAFIFSRRGESNLSIILKQMIDSKETYLPGVLFSARLCLFSESAEFSEKIFKNKYSERKSNAAIQASLILCKYDIVKENIICFIFRALTVVCTQYKQYEDSVLLLHNALRLISMLPNACARFLGVYYDNIILLLNEIHDVVYLKAIGDSLGTILYSSYVIPKRIDTNIFSKIFVNIAVKYLDLREDTTFGTSLVHILRFLGAIALQKIPDFSNGKFSVLLMDDYLDSVRNESVLSIPTKPVAALLAVGLPGSAPYLPTISRLLKEINSLDSVLLRDFLCFGLKCHLKDFIVYLKDFCKYKDNSKSSLLPFFKKKKDNINIQVVLDVLETLPNKSEMKPFIFDLISVLEFIVTIDSSGNFDIYKALESIVGIHADVKWPRSFLEKIISMDNLIPIILTILKNSESLDENILKGAVSSFIKYVSRDARTEWFEKIEYNISDFVSCIHNLNPSREMFEYIMKEISSVLKKCVCVHLFTLTVSSYGAYIQSSDLSFDFSEFFFASCDTLMCLHPVYRVAARDCILSILRCNIPENSELESFGENISYNTIVRGATDLYKIIVRSTSDQSITNLIRISSDSELFGSQFIIIFHAVSQVSSSYIMDSEEIYLKTYIQSADKYINEYLSVIMDTLNSLYDASPQQFLGDLLSVKMNSVVGEFLKHSIVDPDKKHKFHDLYVELISSTKIPLSPNDQEKLVESGLFNCLDVILGVETLNDRSQISYGYYVTLFIIYISYIFAMSANINKSIIDKCLLKIYHCINILLRSIIINYNQKVEFSLKNYISLFQSMGSFSNTLVQLNIEILGDIGKSLFNIVKTQNSNILLVTGFCVSRIIFKLTQCSGDKYTSITNKMQSLLSYIFSISNGEVCRYLSSAINDLYSTSILDTFSDENKELLLSSSLRGFLYQEVDSRQECINFISKLITCTNIEILAKFSDQLVSISVSQVDFRCLASLAYQNDIIKDIPYNLISTAIIKSSESDRDCVDLLQYLTNTHSLDDAIDSLETRLGDHFNGVLNSLFDKLTKSNMTVAGLKFAVKLSARSDLHLEKMTNILYSIIEDSDHILRNYATELLISLVKDQ